MNTAARQDFQVFVNFVKDFSLDAVADDPEKIIVIRHAHAQFLALLTAAGELSSPSGSVQQQFLMSYGDSGQRYLGEVISDCSEFIMCILMGTYRSAGGTLRSAIESYLKAFSANERPSILQRTSVPDVFGDAASASYFSSKIGQCVIADLKGVYNSLNAYVHTVSTEHMFAAFAVGSFPQWSDKSVNLVDLFVRVSRLFLYAIVGVRRDLYDRFDHRNKVITNRAMTRLQRRSAFGIDD